MTALEEVKRMQKQGMPEDQIIQTLQDNGVSYREISDALNQSKIRAAIEQDDDSQMLSQTSSSGPAIRDNRILQEKSQEPKQQKFSQPQMPPKAPSFPEAPTPPKTQEIPESMQGMQQSIMQSTPEEYQNQEYTPTPQNYQDYNQTGYENYQPYDTTGISPDVISEISEQIVSEKLMEIRKPLEKVIDFRNSVEAKTEAIEERLKRIEKIIDALQESVLRKIGDYVTNVDDIKKELIETQKSFTKLVPELKAKKRSKKK